MNYKCLISFKLLIANWSTEEADIPITFSKELELGSIPKVGNSLYLEEEIDLYGIKRKVESIGFHIASNTWIIELELERLNVRNKERKEKKLLIESQIEELNQLLDLGFKAFNNKDEFKLERLIKFLGIEMVNQE